MSWGRGHETTSPVSSFVSGPQRGTRQGAARLVSWAAATAGRASGVASGLVMLVMGKGDSVKGLSEGSDQRQESDEPISGIDDS